MTTRLDPSLLLRLSAGIAQRLADAHDAQAVAKAVLPALARTLHADVANLSLLVDERTLRLVAAVGLDARTLADWAEFDVASPIPIAATARDRNARWLTDIVAARGQYPAIPQGGSASLCTLPLLDRDRVIGVLGVAWHAQHEFQDDERQLLLTVAGLVAATLARQPLPAADRLEARGRAAPAHVSVAELARPGGARCFVRVPEPDDGDASVFVSLVDADPALPSRTIDAVDGLLGLCRRRQLPPALVGGAVAELALDLEGPVTGGHVEIAPADGWLAVAPLDHAVVIVTSGRGAGGTEPPAPGAVAGERVVVDDEGAAAVVVALDVHTDPAAEDAVRQAARAVTAHTRGAGAPALAAALLAELRSRESDACVRGAVVVVLGAVPRRAPRRSRRRLPAMPVSAGLARRFAVAALQPGAVDGLADRLALVTDELVTNAIRHANDGVEVTVTLLDDAVEVGVTDDDDRLPDAPAADASAESGRGYVLLQALADELGVTPRPAGGKTVWARLRP